MSGSEVLGPQWRPTVEAKGYKMYITEPRTVGDTEVDHSMEIVDFGPNERFPEGRYSATGATYISDPEENSPTSSRSFESPRKELRDAWVRAADERLRLTGDLNTMPSGKKLVNRKRAYITRDWKSLDSTAE